MEHEMNACHIVFVNALWCMKKGVGANVCRDSKE